MKDTQPVILLSSQFRVPGGIEHGAECDCACPDNGFNLVSAPARMDVPLGHTIGLHIQDLPNSHTLMFNSLRGSDVAVLNAPAFQVWQHFASPKYIHELALSGTQRNATIIMAQAGLLQALDTITQPHRSAPKTLSAWLHVTNECNLRCDYCYLSKTNEGMSNDIGRAAVDAIVRSAVRNTFKRIKLKFAGGEATLNLKLVFDLHAYAIAQAAQVGIELESVILSNGVAIGERAISEFESRGMRVMISLDGIGEMHNAQRKFINGLGSFAWVSRTLDRLIAHNIKPFISITLTDRNSDGLPDVVRYVLDRDLPFNINFYRENECAAPYTDLRLRDNQIIDALRRAFAIIESDLPERSLLGALVDRSQFNQPHDKTCGVGESYLVIDHKGNVAKCQMEIETPITSVYADDPLAIIREDQIGIQNLSVNEKEGCRDCEWKYWCAGGCPALTFRVTGRYDIKSPNCRIYKAIYPQLLRLEGLRLMKLAGAN